MPEGMIQAVSVVPADVNGTYIWEPVAAGDVLTLTAIPVVLRDQRPYDPDDLG